MTALAMLAAVLLDAMAGEPRRAHPLVMFGGLATRIEGRLHGDAKWRGGLAWMLAVLPLVALCFCLVRWLDAVSPWFAWALSALVLYACIGLRSLSEHARPVIDALHGDDIEAARAAVGRVVSRDVDALTPTQVAGAATESVLENGCDAVFGALFWFALLGAPGAVLYRLANTLDAMWGYRNARYLRFGWAAARIDDLLNLVPARLTALTYALCGRFLRALHCWRTQASAWKSPNAGPVMAAGAGAIGVALGGPAPYHGEMMLRPPLGEGRDADASSISTALRLVRRGVLLWLIVAAAAQLAWRLAHA